MSFLYFARFALESDSGKIYSLCASGDLDFEKRDTYDMSVMVKDSGGRSDTVSLHIHLQDVNDNPPEFTRSVYDVYIDENDNTFIASPFVTVEVYIAIVSLLCHLLSISECVCMS